MHLISLLSLRNSNKGQNISLLDNRANRKNVLFQQIGKTSNKALQRLNCAFV